MRTLIYALFCGLCLPAAAQTPLPANFVLVDVDLGPGSEFVKWTNLKSGHTIQPHSSSTASGASSINVLSPGFRGSMQGFYSFAGDFGYSASLSSPNFDINTVVFQSATMYNPGRGLSVEDYFTYKHTDYYQPGDTSTINPSDPDGGGNYGYSAALGALDTRVENYQGGPVLTWTDATGATGSLTTDIYGFLNEPYSIDDIAHGSTGTYYNFSWTWDLSAIPGNIVSVEITVPLLPHSSTIGSQINISNSILVPEPSAYALLGAAAMLAFTLARRRRRRQPADALPPHNAAA